MENSTSNFGSSIFRSSMGITTVLIVYFLLMRLFGLHELVELRYLNFLILLIGVYLALRKFYTRPDMGSTYLQGFGFGSLVSISSSFIFGFFIYVYLAVFDPSFMDFLRLNAPYGQYLTPVLAPVIVIIEGSTSGVVLSFAIMQYYKKPHIAKN